MENGGSGDSMPPPPPRPVNALSAGATVTTAGSGVTTPAVSQDATVAAALAQRQHVVATARLPPARTSLQLAEAPTAPPTRRGKVPLEKGYSQVDWMRRAAATKPPPPRAVTPAEVAAHAHSDNAWTVLRGRVYDVSRYAAFHPGGTEVLAPAYGRDATRLFDATHAWVNAHALLASCYVGRLVAEGGGGDK